MPKSHEEILASFRKEFLNVHPGDSGIGGNDPQEPVYELAIDPTDPEQVRELETFLLESLKQERLRTLEDAERAVEERKKNRLMGEVVMITDDVANMSLRAGMEDGFDSSLTAIRNLKPKDV